MKNTASNNINDYYDMEKRSFLWYRVIPGVITLVIATSPIWASFLGIYDWLILYLAFIATYITYQSGLVVIANFIGFKRMKRDMRRNWRGNLIKIDFKKLPDSNQIPSKLSDIYHVIFVPIYTEPFEDLDKTFEKIANQDYPYLKKVIISLAVEERAGKGAKEVVKMLKEKYEKRFYAIWDSFHPEGIPGEIIGDACANLRWAGESVSSKLKDLEIDSQNVIFTKFDADTWIHEKFLSALTYKYLKSPRRTSKFFSPAILIYSNNYWRVPSITRMFSAALTLGVLSEWVAMRKSKQTFSCYCANFKLLEDMNYWDASTGAEDTYFYWNALLHKDGDFEGVEFYLPVTMDAVEGKDRISSLKSLYKQQLRWGWGVLIMCIALQGMAKNRKISLIRKLDRFMVLFRAYNFFLTMSILLSFSMPLLTLINRELEFSSTSYLLPRIISIMLTISMLFQIPQKYFIYKYYGAPPKESSIFFKAWWWTLESLVTIVNVWTYYLIPKVQAQFELTIGKDRKKFFVSSEGKTEK
ncbi:MAG: glycosyltransferase family 2 protein [bacterium]